MQERYLGDSHDFLKYALLRHLAKSLDVTLGVNWYLTRPEEVDRPGNNDGEKRHHLSAPDWANIDGELLTALRELELPETRRLESVGKLGILPRGTVYFDTPVPPIERMAWFGQSLEKLAGADLVFLDPDNGFEVASMTRRTKPKYAFFDEAAAYAARDHAIVGIQFARQCDPIQRAASIRNRLIDRHGRRACLPVIRGRVAPNILFFTIAPLAQVADYDRALRNFSTHCRSRAGAGKSTARIQLLD